MKTMKTWKWCAVIALAAGIFASVPAEAAEILTFEFSALAGNEATADSNGNDANLSSSTISRGAGLATGNNSQRFNATSWALASIDNAVSGDDYMEFTITPQSGYQFDVSSVVVQWQRSSTGNRAISLRSSADNYASDLGGVWSLNDATYTQTNTFIFSQSASTASVTYRFYSYAESTGGTGGPGDGAGNDIVVNGTVTTSGGASAPSVATVAASAIDATTATANGDVADDGGDTVTERGVCYKTSSGVALTDNPTAAAAGGTGAFSVDLSSLDVNQIYYFRAYAVNGVDTALAANELDFTTLANVPAVPTVGNPTYCTLDVAVNANGNPASTEFAIQRTSDSLYLQADGTFGASEDWQTAAAWDTTTATGLTPSTEYFFQVKARNGDNVETAFGTSASGTTSAEPTGIWINPMSAGTPMGTYYLGDVMGEWYVNFEIGQTSWDYAQIGVGTSAAGTDYNWGAANWYEDGEGSNKRVRRDLSGVQFTSAANYYVICQAKATSGDDYTSKSGNGWGNSQIYPPADLFSAYFAVSALNDPSGQTAEADQSTQINLFWSNDAQGHDVMVVHKLAADSWTEPTQGQSYSASDAIGAGTVVYKGDSGVFYDTGLLEDTTYDYKFYSVNYDYYSAGVTAQETTLPCEPDAPAGLYVSETNENDFVAAWTAADRATAYRLDVSAEELFGVVSYASDLFISEYVEGSSNNKAIEIYNGTGASIDLSAAGYTLRVYANGGTSPTTIALTGTVAAGDVYVVANPSANAAILAQADQTSGSLTHNGNDQIALAKSAVNVDVIGTIGVNVTNLADVTKVRKSAIDEGVATYDEAEWDDYAVDTTSYLGSHDYSGGLTPSYVDGFEDLLVAGGTSQAVTGLTDNTTYYFRVRAEGEGGCPSADSATASVTTIEATGGPQTIDFPAVGEQTTTNVLVLSATASSGLDVSFAVFSGPASLDGDGVTLTFTAAGEVSVVASQAGGGGWDPAGPVTNSFNVAKAVAVVTLDDLAQAYDGTARSVSATTEPVGLTVDLTYDGGATPPTDPGSYEVIGTVVDDLYQGASTNTLDVTVADPASFASVASGWAAVELSFAPNAAGNDVVIAVNATGVFEAPSGTPSVGGSLGGGTVLYVGAASPQTHADLDSCTPYYYKAWSYVDGFYSVGLADDASTAAPAAPTGLGATPDYTSFVASWNAVDGANGYRLDVSTADDFQSSGNGALFISEVADPYDVPNAKFVELYNASGATIDFDAAEWYLARQANGATWANIRLAGSVSAGSAYVIAYSQTTFDSTFGQSADLYSGNVSGNGDDGYFLVQGGGYGTGTVVDACGVIDQDGTGYDWEYLDKNIVRNADVADPNATWTASEWTVPATTVNAAEMTPGAHTCTGELQPSFVAGYENLAVAGTSQEVSGLAEGVAYYFRVRAEGDACTSEDSAVASTTTPEHLRLVMSQAAVNVHENGQGRFFVRLNQDPGTNVVASVSLSAGDASIEIQKGAALAFRSSNWGTWQVVALAQADDENAASESATFQVSLAGADDQFVAVATLDDDVGTNLALASSGTTVSARYASFQDQLIDGVHGVSTNYGWTSWTNDPQGTITLDLKVTGTVSRVRLLNWDWVWRVQRYQIESSTDGENWTMLADASAEDHRGWDEWIVTGGSVARYLKFTGLSNSLNQCAVVSELEVYGERDLSSLPQPVVSKTSVNVREGGEGRFLVRLDKAPEGSLTVNVTRNSGSDSIAIRGGETWSFTFTAANWNDWQKLTLVQDADDENTVNETSVFRVSAIGRADQFVTATALDDDGIGENLARAEQTSISGVKSSGWASLVDGVHDLRTSYGWTIWTNETPPSTITLDLKTVATVSRVRLLSWDWSYRVNRYIIESSTDNVNWTVLADASGEDHSGWDDWTFAEQSARYLRFTGLWDSYNQFVVLSELEVYGTRDPLPTPELLSTAVNVREAGAGRFFLRLAEAPTGTVTFTVSRSSGDASLAIQGGATRAFKTSNWSTWQAVTLVQAADDGNTVGETATFRISAPGYADTFVTATALDDDIGENLARTGGSTISGMWASGWGSLIDGVHTSSSSYGWTLWSNDPQGTITLDLKAVATISAVRLLSWDWSYRVNRYMIESSTDGVSWSLLVDASGENHNGWDSWTFAEQSARYLRFTGLWDSYNRFVVLSELEVYGTRPAGKRALVAARATESEPVAVLTSEGPADETGWDAVDGDDATAWVGQKAGGGYLVVEYQPTLTLSGLEVDVTEASLADMQVLTSLDGQDWQALPEDFEANPVSLNFLWVIFPDDGSEAVPEVIEIRPNP